MIKQSILLGQKMRLARKEGTRSLLGKNATKFDSKNELLTFMQSNHNQKREINSLKWIPPFFVEQRKKPLMNFSNVVSS